MRSPLAGPKTLPIDLIPNIAVAIADLDWGTHTGIYFRTELGIEFIHLADHHQLKLETPNEDYMWAIPDMLHEDSFQLARLCTLIATHRDEISYGFLFSKHSIFNRSSGVLFLGQGTSGLTCATFVLAAFGTLEFLLLDIDTWQYRPEDHQRLRNYISHARVRLNQPGLADQLEKELEDPKCWRYRPEEVAGACSSTRISVVFEDAKQLAHQALSELDAYYKSNGWDGVKWPTSSQ